MNTKPLSERITQGPWIVDLPNSSNGQLAIKTADKTNNVAIVFGLPMGEVGMANAQLIAQAPTLLAQRNALLAACGECVQLLDENAIILSRMAGGITEPTENHHPIVSRARRLIVQIESEYK